MNIKSLAWSTLLTIIFSTGITLLGELSKPFKDLLTSLSGHHWVTKSIAILIFFAIMYFLLRNLKEEKDLKKTIILQSKEFR